MKVIDKLKTNTSIILTVCEISASLNEIQTSLSGLSFVLFPLSLLISPLHYLSHIYQLGGETFSLIFFYLVLDGG